MKKLALFGTSIGLATLVFLYTNSNVTTFATLDAEQEASMQHMFNAREGSVGGFDGAGGDCGCN